MPHGIREVEPYTEVWRGDGNSQIIRTFDVPWAICKPFVDWTLGYSVNTIADPGSTTGGGYSNVPDGAETVPFPEGGGYSNLANIVNPPPTAGKLSRVIPSQHPLYPWMYAVECELERGMGAINSRRDVTVLLNAAGLPFVPWDTGGYLRGASPPIDVDADGEVIRTRARLVTLQARQTSFLIFPLRGIVNQHPAGEDFFAALGYGAAVPDAELDAYRLLIDAPNLAAVQNLAQGGNVVAQRFLAALTDLELQIVQAQNNITMAIQNAQAVAATRLVVPMIAYVTKPTSALPAPEAYSMPPEYTEDGLARYRVTYRPLPYEVRSDRQMAEADWLTSSSELERYVERQVNYSLKAFQIPVGQLKFYEGPFLGIAVPAPGSIPFGIQELLYTWYDVPDVPEDAISACEGKVNATAFDGAFGAPTYPAQTLLMQAPKKFRIPRNIRGRVTWRIVYSFLYQPFGWNKFPAGSGATFNFYGATIGGAAPAADGSNLIYKTADFASLFTQPLPRDYQVIGRG